MTNTDHLVKPITCPRCSGTGFVNSHVQRHHVPGLCFRCEGSGVVEGDPAALRAQREVSKAAKAFSERRRLAYDILCGADLGHGDLTNAGARARLDAREYRHLVTWGFNTLEANDPDRFAKAVDSILAGHPTVFTCLADYGRAHPSN